MNFILKLYLRKGTKMELFTRLNNYANFTSKYCRFLYDDYCENLSQIIKEIKEKAK
jgi:hypothetical protein